MATYRKMLKDKDGNNIIPITHDNLITVYGNYGDTSFTPDQTVPMNTLLNKVGGSLSISGNGVAIGSGIKKVLISANLFTSNGSSGYSWFKIMKNSSEVINSISYTTTNSFGSVIFTPILVEVQEEDVITIKCQGNNARVRGDSSWLTIQAVE